MNIDHIIGVLIWGTIALIAWKFGKKFVPQPYRHKVELAYWGVRHLTWGTIRQDRAAKIGAYMVVVGWMSIVLFGDTGHKAPPSKLIISGPPPAATSQVQQPALPPPPAPAVPPADSKPSDSGVIATPVTHTFHPYVPTEPDAPAEQSNPN